MSNTHPYAFVFNVCAIVLLIFVKGLLQISNLPRSLPLKKFKKNGLKFEKAEWISDFVVDGSC